MPERRKGGSTGRGERQPHSNWRRDCAGPAATSLPRPRSWTSAAGPAACCPTSPAWLRAPHCAGCDVDRDAIEWAVAHRPGPAWTLSSFEPPLPYAAGSFDLVYAVSVFSHLGRGPQERWLAELARVLRPGGVALLSVHGPTAFDAFRTGRVRTAWCPRDVFAREPLRERDFVFAPYAHSPWTVAELPGVGRDYGLAFHGQRSSGRPGAVISRCARSSRGP